MNGKRTVGGEGTVETEEEITAHGVEVDIVVLAD